MKIKKPKITDFLRFCLFQLTFLFGFPIKTTLEYVIRLDSTQTLGYIDAKYRVYIGTRTQLGLEQRHRQTEREREKGSIRNGIGWNESTNVILLCARSEFSRSRVNKSEFNGKWWFMWLLSESKMQWLAFGERERKREDEWNMKYKRIVIEN